MVRLVVFRLSLCGSCARRGGDQSAILVPHSHLCSNLRVSHTFPPLPEAQGHIVTIELKTGELYRGHLLGATFSPIFFFLLYFLCLAVAAGRLTRAFASTSNRLFSVLPETEDSMNCHMQNITLTARDGKVSKLEYVYIRGSKIRFMIVPDMLKVCSFLHFCANLFALAYLILSLY